MTLFARRLALARQGDAALAAEMDDWVRRSKDTPTWHRHRRQLERLSATVEGLLEAARLILNDVRDDAAGWRALLRFERALLAANRIWDHFRAKYLVRLHDGLGLMLRMADSFAWACYAPVQQACRPEKRAPPLVYFSETWSPFALARDRSFANELRVADAGTARILLDAAFESTLARLPVPLVSLPWFQASHTPSVLIVAHEVGHIVSADFALGAALAQAIDQGDWAADKADWQRWREELFADLFGVIVARDGFVGTLIALLATDRDQIASDDFLTGPYPPRSLRMEIALAALERLEQPQDRKHAELLRRSWEEACGDAARFAPHMQDVARLIDMVMGLPCGQQRLDSLFCVRESDVMLLKSRALNGQKLAQRDFNVTAALVLAQRIDDDRASDLSERDRARALATIPGFVDQQETGYLGEPASRADAVRTQDAALGATLWQDVADGDAITG